MRTGIRTGFIASLIVAGAATTAEADRINSWDLDDSLEPKISIALPGWEETSPVAVEPDADNTPPAGSIAPSIE